MKLIALFGSPRKGGNSDLLLDEFLKGLESAKPGLQINRVYIRERDIQPCKEYNACLKTGKCVIKDDMNAIYEELLTADALALSAPMFFFNLPAQTKALVDRCQAIWARKYVLKDLTAPANPRPAFFLSVGGSKGLKAFDGVTMTVKYFFKSINFDYTGSLFYNHIDKKGDIKNHPTAMKDAFQAGADFAAKLKN